MSAPAHRLSRIGLLVSACALVGVAWVAGLQIQTSSSLSPAVARVGAFAYGRGAGGQPVQPQRTRGPALRADGPRGPMFARGLGGTSRRRTPDAPAPWRQECPLADGWVLARAATGHSGAHRDSTSRALALVPTSDRHGRVGAFAYRTSVLQRVASLPRRQPWAPRGPPLAVL
jgi:hypothetical protein